MPTQAGIPSPVGTTESPDRIVRPRSAASQAAAVLSSGLVEAAAPSSNSDLGGYETANTSMGTSQAGGSTNYQSPTASVRVPVASRSNTFVTTSSPAAPQARFDVSGALESSEDWATPTSPTSTQSGTPRGSTYGRTFESEQSTERSTNIANLMLVESHHDVFYDSIAASVVGWTFPTHSERLTERSTHPDWESPSDRFYDSAAASVVGTTYRSDTDSRSTQRSITADLEPRGAVEGSVVDRSDTDSERTRSRERSFVNLEPRIDIFYDSAAASVVGSSRSSSTNGADFELPEIPSESQVNSPAASLMTLGSSKGRASPALSSVPSVIPSISSWSSEAGRVRLPPSASSQVLQLSSLSPSLSLPSIPTPRDDPKQTPSPSSMLSPTPSSLMPSAEQDVEVATPTSLSLALNIEETETLSSLSSLPLSITPGATSVATPTSLIVSPVSDDSDSDEYFSTSPATVTSFTQTSTTSFLPPVSRVKAWASSTDLSYNSSVLQPSPSIHSVSFREDDEEEVHVSFETSFLRPSSVVSTPLRSFTASSPPIRPPGPIPPSSATASSPALPPSISSQTDISTPSTLSLTSVSSSRISRPLPPVPISLATESLISTSIVGSEPHLPRARSPITFGRPISTPSGQPSSQRITDTETSSPLRVTSPAPTPNPTPSAASTKPTPSGSIIVSITTPHGSGSTEKPSLRTVPSEVSAVTERDLAHDFDRLVDELHTYNLTRGLEHTGLTKDVQALKNEVRGLAGLVRMRPSVATPAVLLVPSPQPHIEHSAAVAAIITQEEQPRHVALDAMDRIVGGSSPMSSVSKEPVMVPVEVPNLALSPSASSSEVKSVHSYLSSHHSDDDVFQIEEELLMPPIHSPILPAADVKDPATDRSLQISSESESSSLSSSPYASSSELSEGWLETPNDADPIQYRASHPPEIHQLPESVEQALEGIQDQIVTLDDGQNANIALLQSLQGQPDPEGEDRRNLELLERLGHIEELLGMYLEQGQQQQKTPSPITSSRKGFDQVPVSPPPPLPRVSMSDSGDSVRRLRMFLSDLANQIDNDYDHSIEMDSMSMPPLPLSATTPSISRPRMDDVLQPLDINIFPPFSQSEIPCIEPLNLLYGDSIIGRGERPRSTSPMSVDKLPPLPYVSSVVFPVPVPPSKARRKREQRRNESERRHHLRSATPDVERLLNKRRIEHDIGANMKTPSTTQLQQRPNQEWRQLEPPQQQQPEHVFQQPARQLVLRSALKKTTNAVPAPQVSGPGLEPQIPLPGTKRTRLGAVQAERTYSDSQIPQQNALPSRTKSWYRPRDEQRVQHPMNMAFVEPRPIQTEVAIPSLTPSMNILREQRLAQLATVDQQRELMKYMKGLNQWLERDVKNRREEFKDVFQTVEDLRRQIRGMRRKKGKGDGDRRDQGRRTSRLRTPSSGLQTIPSTPGPRSVAPQPQRWTAVPALLQPLPVHSQTQQRIFAGDSRTQGSGSRVSFVPAAVQSPSRPQLVQPHRNGQLRAQQQPTIILLPPQGQLPGQIAQSNFHPSPVDWGYPEFGDERGRRNGTRRSRGRR